MAETIFLTREADKNEASQKVLKAAGIDAVSVPMIQIQPLAFTFTSEMLQADWVFFTSQNAVRYFF
ncbi:uroporphyrinogen-III synthase [Listeria floridensis FSL S10-1187]|uniref:Uroporphyrinogen-III synthase n=1 Tax=Listeria floridensis FSL S10-1187 TaxID=1265817 RepID=A0ABP3B258_9LIST|nr:uroporphyrinogen-III synthase [Listeria floridensis]EUJ33252.1 uroporphyrinogen-III synthase [Listeria floridensis FSL S10-1187]